MPRSLPSQRGVEERNALVEANVRLVPWVVQRFAYTSDEEAFQQRVAAGYLGLIRAAELFDESRGFKFSTYAVGWIRQALQRAQSEALIRVPECAKARGVQEARVVSLDAPRGEDDRATIGDLIAAPEDDRSEELAQLRELLAQLPALERNVVLARHTPTAYRSLRGWSDVAEVTGLADGRDTKAAREEARRVYAGAIARLRALAREAA